MFGKCMSVMYTLKISSKSVNVATSYKRLKMMKIAVCHHFWPITVINLKIFTPFDACRLFLHQPISIKFSACI